MIAGIGTDIVEVDRVAASIEKGKGFRELVFTPLEIAYCEQQANKYQSYAARFAAKEAFLKALGTGFGYGGVHFKEIEISNNEAGKPSIHLLGDAEQLYTVRKIRHISVSLSHVKTMATAFVIIEGEEK